LLSQEKDAKRIGERVRALRLQRRFSQAELGKELGLSQARLSQIERGQGSFSAEQLLRILSIFNVGVEHFAAPSAAGASPIQNALARHGATHLAHDDTLLPATLDEPGALVFSVLLDPESPRHVTSLAPVLTKNIDRISLPMIASKLSDLGREARLGWLLESVRTALAQTPPSPYAAIRRDVHRTLISIDQFLASHALRLRGPLDPIDLFDRQIRSAQTAERVLEEASDEAKRWRIATRLAPSDFADAWRAANEAR
jgi:transcriptional regulator with XRE-family HTH domain